jgi:hypothetical protein
VREFQATPFAASRVRKGTGCDTRRTRALTDTAELLFTGTILKISPRQSTRLEYLRLTGHYGVD